MGSGRFLSLVLAAATFLLQGGDCVSLFFADNQSRDCCRKGHCSPKNPDPCCQVSPKETVEQAQVKEKAPFVELVDLAVLPAWTVPTHIVSIRDELKYALPFEPSPPGQLGNFSVPLLV